MGVTVQQPTTLQPAHVRPPPPMAPQQKFTYSDMFLEMIQGNSVTVVVGQHPSSRTYTLPAALLCVHSIYFRDQIARMNATESKDHAASKKRKLSTLQDDKNARDDKVLIKEEDREPSKEETTKNNTMNKGNIITLPDVEPAIFGLFLKFIYKDSYPPNIDARPISSNSHRYPRTAVTKLTTPVPAPPVTPQQLPSKTPLQTYVQSTSIPGHPLTHLQSPVPTTMPPPPIPHNITSPQTIPPSIQAWLLAQRLGALSFMNHTIQHIYSGIGCYFALTPTLIDHVWRETTPSFSPITTILTPSPLRNLLLHILTSYWSQPPSHQQNPNSIIMRSLPGYHANASKGLKDAWDRLFNEHRDLRNEFIHGLQAGPGQLGVVGAYFASSTPVVVSGGSERGGRSEAAKRKEVFRPVVREGANAAARKEKGHEDCVIIKEEKDDETKVLGEAKEFQD
ncbi:hypothetical protein BKA58DRAFT_457068 [Alternaria rosae]|uniref:uncharacterized protein n=1 Tax=Alternaria rosae TaxID=1187941 RepID=UPI001E8D6DB5|nr:uncharacterized protein BKA58DRAFT_449634 [Alternaria rosae]XP_046026984.1 uncharacterized protein BKA58DRAFT_457068 [Alternaria rosae]KAH6859155.1 hypothetical protein BKA58DRAFT_449634 [Alternaria rosae]KAH6873401.1 hypothetical protein BKA58DRAFT_457068 [Alternaria rosae]